MVKATHQALPAMLNPRLPSLVRGSVLVLGSLFAAFRLSDFPRNRPSLLITLPTLLSFFGTWETVRCLQRRWSFYHAGVILCIYMDVMADAMVLFLLLYPYMQWITTHS